MRRIAFLFALAPIPLAPPALTLAALGLRLCSARRLFSGLGPP
jgi:hypothetical protein